jgi:hypothetical protein
MNRRNLLASAVCLLFVGCSSFAPTPNAQTVEPRVAATAPTPAPATPSGWVGKWLTFSILDPYSGRETGTRAGRLSTDASGSLRIDEDAFVIDSRGKWKSGNWLPVAVLELPTPISFSKGDQLTLITTANPGTTMRAEVRKARRATLNLSGLMADIWQLSISGVGDLDMREGGGGTARLIGELEMEAGSGLVTRLRLQVVSLNVSSAAGAGPSPFETAFALKSIY